MTTKNRYIKVKSEKNRWVIVDTKDTPPKILATCAGWDKYDNAELICKALNEYSAPIDKLLQEAVKEGKND